MSKLLSCVAVPVFALVFVIVMTPILLANVAWWYIEDLWKGKD